MAISDSAWPSSAAFDDIAAALTSEADKKEAIKQGGAIFAFAIKNTGGQEKTWFIDLKSSGEVGQGTGPSGKKADVTLVLTDDNFAKLVAGKANAQKLFMSGKLKVRGNVTKATKLEPILKKAQPKAKL